MDLLLLLNACERVRDYERAAEWCGKVEEFSRGMRTNFVTLACRAHYGAVLTWQGRWPEAEQSLTEATEPLATERPSWSGLAIVRLADLRRRQGRFPEAEELLHRAAGNPLAPVVRPSSPSTWGCLDGRRPARAGASPRPGAEQDPAGGPAGGDGEGAGGTRRGRGGRFTPRGASVDRGAVGTRPLRASVSVSEGLVAAAAGDEEKARERLEDAVELFAASGASFELGRARLELARVLASLGREDAAVREATLALSVSTRSERRPRRRGLASCSGGSGPAEGHAAPPR